MSELNEPAQDDKSSPVVADGDRLHFTDQTNYLPTFRVVAVGHGSL
jgi:hypothetical protein